MMADHKAALELAANYKDGVLTAVFTLEQTKWTNLAACYLDLTAQLEAERKARETLEKHTIKLEEWGRMSIIEWAELGEDTDRLMLRVIDECKNLRRGIGVSYSYADDPVRKLESRLPDVGQLDAVRACREKAKLTAKSPEQEVAEYKTVEQRAEAAEAKLAAVEAALSELVRLKELKDTNEYLDSADQVCWRDDKKQSDYLVNKPLAWKAAIRALNRTAAAQEPPK